MAIATGNKWKPERSLIMITALATVLTPILADGPYIYWGGGGLGLIVVIVIIVLLLRR
jgi:hypothetical protein